jgi:hypothetical protein
LGFSPSRFDISPTFRALVECIQEDLERSGAAVFCRIDRELFEKAVTTVEVDPEVVRLWTEIIEAGGKGDPEHDPHPALMRAIYRCSEIVQEIIPSDCTSGQSQVWVEVYKRLAARLGPIDKGSS